MTPSPLHDNPSASPSTATGEQRTLLEVSSTGTVVAHNRRSTKGWCSVLAAATLLVCMASRRGGVPTVHDSPLRRGNTDRSAMSAVHDVPEAGTKGGS